MHLFHSRQSSNSTEARYKTADSTNMFCKKYITLAFYIWCITIQRCTMLKIHCTLLETSDEETRTSLIISPSSHQADNAPAVARHAPSHHGQPQKQQSYFYRLKFVANCSPKCTTKCVCNHNQALRALIADCAPVPGESSSGFLVPSLLGNSWELIITAATSWCYYYGDIDLGLVMTK